VWVDLDILEGLKDDPCYPVVGTASREVIKLDRIEISCEGQATYRWSLDVPTDVKWKLPRDRQTFAEILGGNAPNTNVSEHFPIERYVGRMDLQEGELDGGLFAFGSTENGGVVSYYKKVTNFAAFNEAIEKALQCIDEDERMYSYDGL
jgi:hypothetical protein